MDGWGFCFVVGWDEECLPSLRWWKHVVQRLRLKLAAGVAAEELKVGADADADADADGQSVCECGSRARSIAGCKFYSFFFSDVWTEPSGAQVGTWGSGTQCT